MRDMMAILHIYCVQRIGPANPHWAIYYFKAIVYNPNRVIIYVKNAFFLNHKCSYSTYQLSLYKCMLKCVFGCILMC